MKKQPAKKQSAKPQPAKKAAPSKPAPERKAAISEFAVPNSLEEIKDLVEYLSSKNYDEIELERGDFHLRVRRGGPRRPEGQEPPPPHHPPAHHDHEAPPPPPAAAAHAAPSAAPAPAAPEDLYILNSPIVGTFYRASSPDADPFVKVGDSISVGQTLCIVEAMKLMNEIQSDVAGSIVKIFVDNGQPVEYGQPLFGIKK